jgi:hypothetical protein
MWKEAAASKAKSEGLCEDCGAEPCSCKSESKDDKKVAMTGKPMAGVEVAPKESKAK